jgi:methyltransferase (TIGR00027 family)
VKAERASSTAAWVAGCRGLGSLLGEAQIADDPYGLRFGGPFFASIERASRVWPLGAALAAVPALMPWVAYMQVRTRAIDDELLAFGGDQVVILGAGYDCRAARFARELRGTSVFEVDHPATQARKREVIGETATEYVPWDFEAQPLEQLPEALVARGLDPARPTLTIWEGVTMYLSEPAIDATVAAIHGLGGEGSRLVFTYIERAVIDRPPVRTRALRTVLAGVGEPFRFGWHPAALPDWLDARGLELESDRAEVELAADLLPPRYSTRVTREGRHVAVASVHPRGSHGSKRP